MISLSEKRSICFLPVKDTTPHETANNVDVTRAAIVFNDLFIDINDGA